MSQVLRLSSSQRLFVKRTRLIVLVIYDQYSFGCFGARSTSSLLIVLFAIDSSIKNVHLCMIYLGIKC